jgi:tRNA 2-thiouridine synthesizing protein C
MIMKKVLFISYLPAPGSIFVNETFRTAFGMYGEDIEPVILLMEDSVVALNKKYEPERLGLLPLRTVHRYIDRYGTKVYAVKEDIEERKVEIGDEWNVELISKNDLPEFTHEFDLVIFM